MTRIALVTGLAALCLAATGCKESTSTTSTDVQAAQAPTTTDRAKAPTKDTPAKDTPAKDTAKDAAQTPPNKKPDVIFVPTPEARVKAMLQLAKPKKGEKLYDLGCGDGRIPIAAARDYGVRGVCIDIDPQRITEAKKNVEAAKVGHLVEVRQADLFQTDFSDADIVTLYLLQSLNVKLRPKLQQDLKPGSRIVSHYFDMGDWKPEVTKQVDGAPVYLWTIPTKTATRGR